MQQSSASRTLSAASAGAPGERGAEEEKRGVEEAERHAREASSM